MSKFLRLPAFSLGIIAIIAVMLSNFGIISITESLILLMVGMGAVVGIINIASIISFYRTYYKNSAGTYTFRLEGQVDSSASRPVTVYDSSLTAIYIPTSIGVVEE